jgi:hypothetical protein
MITDAKVIKALTDAGLRKEVPLTPEQEELFKQAIDPEEAFLASVKRIFNKEL